VRAVRSRPDPYRWVVLGAGTLAQGSTAALFLGLASVTPLLRTTYDVDVAGVGALLGAVSVGILATLLPWGVLTDRVGERPVMVTGLVGTAATLLVLPLVGTAVPAALLLGLAGAFGASVNAASGRAVMTWFPARGRGVAMGVRQSATPLGAALAAALLPQLAAAHGLPGVYRALAVVAGTAAVVVLLAVHEPAGSTRSARTPVSSVLRYRPLWRLSLASGLLVVPQFTVGALLVEYLHDDRGLTVAVAAAVLAAGQLASALGRLGIGAWSDRTGSRVRPLRAVGVATAAAFALVAVVDLTLDVHSLWLLGPVLVVATVLATCWNGLAFTLAGEIAPPGQAAAAMSVENSANYLAAALTPVALGAVATGLGWWATFALAGLAAAVSAVLLRSGGATAEVLRADGVAAPAR
jgi:sugar phosphate permease